MFTLPEGYQEELIAEIRRIDPVVFDHCIRILLDAYRNNRQVFIAGNGGSAATANHFVCDFGKNATRSDRRRFRILSVCDNIAKVTAIANDISFDEVFRHQLGNLMQPDDVLIVISASGNSPARISSHCPDAAAAKSANTLKRRLSPACTPMNASKTCTCPSCI